MNDAVGEQPTRTDQRFDQSSWAVLALALLIVIGSALLLLHRLGLPDDGYTFQIDSIGSRFAAGALVIDSYTAILAVDDQPAAEILARAMTFQVRPPPSWRLGGQPRYTYASGEGSYQATIFLRAPGRLQLEDRSTLALLAYLPVAALVFGLRPRLAAAQVLLLFTALLLGQELALLATNGWSELRLADLFSPWSFWPTTLLNTNPFQWLLLIHFALVFPHPKPLYLRHKARILGAIYVLPALLLGAAAVWLPAAGQPMQLFTLLTWLPVPLIICVSLVTIWSLISSYRHARDEVERAQVRWGGLGLVLLSLWFGAMLAGFALNAAGIPIGSALNLLWSISPLVIAAPPLCIAIAILRYRLFAIDLILNRTLVYGALTLTLAAAYVLLAGGLGLLLGGGQGWPQSVLAVGGVAALANPLRERLQRAVNRALYGERDAPYAALTLLGDRLGATIVPDEVLPSIVGAVVEALRLPYVAITSRRRDTEEEEVLAAHTTLDNAVRATTLTRFPIIYQGEALGVLVVAPRQGEAGFSAADIRLLNALARQAGAAVHGARLTADLRRSREQLVLAREEERRRLQRDLHDGLGPALGGLTLKIDAARNLLGADPVAADRLLGELGGQIQSAVIDIRRLVYALRPPVLDQRGLADAIEELADKLDPAIAIELRLPDLLPALPAAVELAAYRIIQEALTNIARHSGARRCEVVVEMTRGHVKISVRDDGHGISDAPATGLGLASMRERAEELGGRCAITPCPGGGTQVQVLLPV